MNIVSERDQSWVTNNRCLLETYKYSHSGFCFHMVSYVSMIIYNRIGGVMVSVIASSVVGRAPIGSNQRQ